MSSLTVTYTDNGDGTLTATTAGPTGTAAVKITSKSLSEVCNVANGWVLQSIPGLIR